jgi:hypothetical protein
MRRIAARRDVPFPRASGKSLIEQALEKLALRLLY